jgi:hypothetical protein
MADDANEYEVSSTYVSGLMRAIRSAGLLTEAVLARLGSEQRMMIDAPYARRWWNGPESSKVTASVAQVHGTAKLEEAGYVSAKHAVGPIIAPMVSVIGAIFGLSPTTLFARMADLSSTSIRNVTMVWASTGPTAGTLTLSYPCPFAREGIEPLWRGACRYVFELAHAKGGSVTSRLDGHALVIDCQWAAK